MATENYHVEYTGDSGKATAAIDAYLARLKALDAMLDRVEAKSKNLFRNNANLAQAVAALNKVAQALNAVNSAAGKAGGGVANVGKNTSNMAAATTQAGALNAALAATATQAAATASAVQGVGAGMPAQGAGGGSAPAGKAGLAGGLRIGGGIVVARKLLDGSSDAFSEAEKTQIAYTEKAQQFREARREVAAMMGKNGPDNDVVMASARTMLASGLTSDEEAQFTGEYYGSSATGKAKGNLGRLGKATPAAEVADLEQGIRDVAARFSVQTGMSPKTTGDLAGVISQYMPVKSPEDIAGQLSASHKLLQDGRGRVDPMMQGMMAQAPQLIASGRMKSLPEVAAFTGMASTFSRSPKSAGVTMSWLDRALNRQNGSAGAYIEGLGANAKSTDLEKLDLVAADLAKVKGDKMTYLARQGGMGSMEDVKALIAYTEFLPELKGNIARGEADAKDGKGAVAAGIAAQSSPNVRRRLADAKGEVAEVTKGMDSEAMVSAMVGAKADLVNSGGIDTTLTNLTDFASDWSWNILSKQGLGQGNRGHRIKGQAIDNLAGEFEQVGVPAQDFRRAYPKLMNDDFATSAKEFERATKDLKAMQDAAADHKAAAAALQAAAKALNPGAPGNKFQQLPDPLPPGGGGQAFAGRP